MPALLGLRPAASIAVAPSSIPSLRIASVLLWLHLGAPGFIRSPSSSESAAARSSGSRLPARWVAGIRQNESTASAESQRGILRRGWACLGQQRPSERFRATPRRLADQPAASLHSPAREKTS